MEETRTEKIFRLVCRLTETNSELNQAKSKVSLMEERRDKILEELKLIVLQTP